MQCAVGISPLKALLWGLGRALWWGSVLQRQCWGLGGWGTPHPTFTRLPTLNGQPTILESQDLVFQPLFQPPTTALATTSETRFQRADP